MSRIVVDSGLARRPRYDRGAGLTRLVTERASRAAVTQRAGRAARQAPGVAIRLWEEAATAALPAHDPPEILEADLSSLLLTCLLWGEADPARLPFLDPPPAAALAEARARLARLGAIDDDGPPHRARPRHRRHAARPAPGAHADRGAGARVRRRPRPTSRVLLTERGLGGNDPDLEVRHRRWRSERGPRAEAAQADGGAVGRNRTDVPRKRRSAIARGRRPRLSRPPVAPPRFVGRAVAVGRRARLPARPGLAAGAQRMAGGRPRSPARRRARASCPPRRST